MLRPLFRGEGTTEGERELAKLADLSFFGLWSYASVHRRIAKGGQTLGHEVADLVVVFGKDVILFSEKDIEFPSTADLAVAWGRWFRTSVSKSVAQLRGAERHVKSRGALFLDAACKHSFPLSLDTAELRVHLVAICRNAAPRARSHFLQANGSKRPPAIGSLKFDASLQEEQMVAAPFHIGDFDATKTFVHVFDAESLDLLLLELGTGPDFIDYLECRERAVRIGGLKRFASEEDLLAQYLSHVGCNGFSEYAVRTRVDGETSCVADELPTGGWLDFEVSQAYGRHSVHRRDSLAWKRITNELSEAVMAATVGEAREESLESHELAIRAMASENRVSRAALGRALIEKFESVPTNARSSRLVASVANPERMYVFVLVPHDPSLPKYEDYRVLRLGFMQMYARVAQMKFPEFSQFVILGADTKGSRGSSETVLVVEGRPHMSDEEKSETLAVMDEHKILTNLRQPDGGAHQAESLVASLLSGFSSVTPDKLPGVNEPCYCGSGRKFKKCCRL